MVKGTTSMGGFNQKKGPYTVQEMRKQLVSQASSTMCKLQFSRLPGCCVIHPCSRESLTDRLFDRDHAYDAMSEHNRRPHYWKYYHLAHSGEIAFLSNPRCARSGT